MTGVPLPRTTFLVILVTTAIATLLTAIPRSYEWYGSWRDTGAALEVATALLYPFVAGVAAWFGSAPRRSGYRHLVKTAARSGLAVPATVVLLVAGAASSGLLAAATGIGLATAREADFGSPPFLSVLVVLCGLASSAAFGCACAARLPAYLAPVLALATVYGVEMFFVYNTSQWPALSGLAVEDGHGSVYSVTEPWMLWVRGAWLLAVGLTCLVVAAGARRHLWASLALASILATPLLWVGRAGMRTDEAALAPVCHTDGTTRICLTAERAHVADELDAAYAPIAAFVSGFSAGRVLLYEGDLPPSKLYPDLSDGLLRVPISVPNELSGNAHRVSPDEFVAYVTGLLLQPHCRVQYSQAPTDLLAATVNDALHLWLLKQADVDPDDPSLRFLPFQTSADTLDWSQVADFRSRWLASDEAARSAWLRTHARDVLRCRVDPADTAGL